MEYDLIIIGFGISGISIAKEAIKRNKKILILEKESNFGGVWYNAHKNCELQTHKTFYEFCEETTMSKSIRHYPTKEILLKYLEDIVNKYNINDYVKYNYNVEKLKQKDGNYIVNDSYISKYICICCGVNNTVRKIEALKDYKGKIIYSKYLKDFDYNIVKNKNVLIVGNGASACDVIKSIDKLNKKNILTCIYKTPKYFINKVLFGFPISLFLNELVLLLFKKMNIVFYRIIIKLIFLFFFGNVLEIPYDKMNSNNLVGSNIINSKIKNGTLMYLKEDLQFAYNNNVICSKNILLNIDYIFCCNGYNSEVNFIGKIPKKRDLGIFHKDYKNIGFIGYNPSYNWPKISEKQSILFLDYIDNNLHVNKYYEKKILDKEDYTYNLYDFLKL
jgi:hypothetical protein